VSTRPGLLVLLGGGEFSFGETLEADRSWVEALGPGPIGFLPAASGSVDYGHHLATYFRETFGREVETIPVYRERDARRARNRERIESAAAVYVGGGLAGQLVEAIAGSPVHEALRAKAAGGVVVAIAAAAQACGAVYRTLPGGGLEAGLGLLPGVAVEPNFDPGHDRRLRSLLAAPGVERGLGLPAGSALQIDAEGRFEAVGDVFALAAPDADLVPLVGEPEPGAAPAS